MFLSHPSNIIVMAHESKPEQVTLTVQGGYFYPFQLF